MSLVVYFLSYSSLRGCLAAGVAATFMRIHTLTRAEGPSAKPRATVIQRSDRGGMLNFTAKTVDQDRHGRRGAMGPALLRVNAQRSAPKQTTCEEFKHAERRLSLEVRGQLLALISSVFVSGTLVGSGGFFPSAETLSAPAVGRHRARGSGREVRPLGLSEGGTQGERNSPVSPRFSLLTGGFHKVAPAVASC